MRPFACVVIGLLFLVSCGRDRERLPTISTAISFEKEGELTFLNADGDTITTIDIEIAETDQERTRGLMGRRGLPRQSGMLFIMDRVDTTGFWMKNTPLPLDLVFVDEDLEVINIVKRTTPYSEDLILPAAPKKYVVELRGGYTDRAGIGEDARIAWKRVN